MNISFNAGSGIGGLGGSLMRNRRSKFGFGSLIMFLVFAAAFGGAGLYLAKALSVQSNWTRVSGEVIADGQSTDAHGNLTYAPTVQYSAGGKTYTVQSSVSSGARPAIGSAMQIAYDPTDPAQSKVVESGLVAVFPFLFGGIGLLMLVLGPVLFVRSVRRGRDISNLKQSGQKVQGVITAMQATNSNVGYNRGMGTTMGSGMGPAMSTGNSGYKVTVSAPDLSGAVRNFVSDSVMGVGELAMADFAQHPIPIDVYINPSNPDDYYVDIEELPNLTPERIKDLIASATGQAGAGAVMSETPPVAPMPPAAPPVEPPVVPAPPADPPPPA